MIEYKKTVDLELGAQSRWEGNLNSQDLETLVEAFTKVLIDYNKLSEAISDSMGRYWKAMELNEVEYEILQGNELIKYLNLFVEKMRTMKDIIPFLKQKIKEYTDNQSEEISNVLDNLPQEEFPVEFEKMLNSKGIASLDINGLLNSLNSTNLEKITEDVDSYLGQLISSLSSDIDNYTNLVKLIDSENRKILIKSIPEPVPSIARAVKSNAQFCIECGTSLTWIDEYKRWYCYKCEEYR